MQNQFNILALSGGGYFGLYTASVLAGIEAAIKRPIATCFDLMAGTSVGGIIALGLAAEVPASAIVAAFERNGTAIFSKRPAPGSKIGAIVDVARSLVKSKYSSDGLRSTIEDILGKDTRIGDLPHRVIVPSVNLTRGLPQVFKTAHHPDFFTDLHRRAVDVALATSAAPTFFPVAELDDALFADGGLYANSPDQLALHEAEHFLQQEKDDIHLLSVGTTTAQFSLSHLAGRNLGATGWLKDQRLFNAMLAAQQHSVNFMVRHRLGERYMRLDESQTKEHQRVLALDVATKHAQQTIRALAAATLQRSLGSAALQQLLAHHAAAPVFYHQVA